MKLLKDLLTTFLLPALLLTYLLTGNEGYYAVFALIVWLGSTITLALIATTFYLVEYGKMPISVKGTAEALQPAKGWKLVKLCFIYFLHFVMVAALILTGKWLTGGIMLATIFFVFCFLDLLRYMQRKELYKAQQKQ